MSRIYGGGTRAVDAANEKFQIARTRQLLRWLAFQPEEVRQRVWRAMEPRDFFAYLEHWGVQHLTLQEEPPGDWRVWLLMAGRGFGKTRIGAEWVLERARAFPHARIALVGGSLEEVGRVMVEGESGIRRSARAGEHIDWRVSRGELRFPSGAVGQAFSGADGERLRGPQHHFAWADELGKWTDADNAWDNLMLGLRIGDHPQAVITTTPGNAKLIRRILALPGTEVSRGKTQQNLALPPAFLEAIEAAYRGTRLGRQELDGEMLSECADPLWTRATIEKCRLDARGIAAVRAGVSRVVIGVDPPATAGGDACGISVCAVGPDGVGAVLADLSCRGERPEGWARRVADAADAWNADRVVAECNNGGEMVEQVLRQVAPALPVRLVRASRGKVARAEPIAALFEIGRVEIAGLFAELEDELTQFAAGGYQGSGSPDRADAMVWALSALMIGPRAEPRFRML